MPSCSTLHSRIPIRVVHDFLVHYFLCDLRNCCDTDVMSATLQAPNYCPLCCRSAERQCRENPTVLQLNNCRKSIVGTALSNVREKGTGRNENVNTDECRLTCSDDAV